MPSRLISPPSTTWRRRRSSVRQCIMPCCLAVTIDVGLQVGQVSRQFAVGGSLADAAADACADGAQYITCGLLVVGLRGCGSKDGVVCDGVVSYSGWCDRICVVGQCAR